MAERQSTSLRGSEATAAIHKGYGLLLKLCFIAITFLYIVSNTSPAHAVCSNPAGNAGQMVFNADGPVMQYCNDTNWVPMGPRNPSINIGPTDGLVHYWPLNETTLTNGSTITDVIGGAHGTVNGTLTSVSGLYGTAIQTDADNEFIDTGVLSALEGQSQFTISAWLKRNAASSRIMLGRYDGGEGTYMDIWSDNRGYFGNHDGTGTANCEGYLSDGTTANANTDWVLMTMVYDGTLTGNTNRMKGYLNGSQVTFDAFYNGACTMPATSSSSSLNFTIGSLDTLYSRASYDDVRIYNRPLTDNEVMDLYNAVHPITQIVPDGLIAHWKLDETSGTDVIDYASVNNGTMSGGLTGANSVPGKVGTALDFDASGHYVAIANEANFDITSSMTAAAWIRTDGLVDDWAAIVAKGAGGSWRLMRTGNTGTISFHMHNVTLSLDGTIDIEDGQWHHVVGVFDDSADTGYIYIDGVLDAEETGLTGSIGTNDDEVRIGNAAGGAVEWTGDIDDVRIYDRAISADEVRQLYAAHNAKLRYNANARAPEYFNGDSWVPAGIVKPTTAGLVGHWKLDEESGAFTDSSGNGNDGTQSGGVEYASAGVIRNSVAFDGANDYIEVSSDSVYTNLSEITGTAWVYVNQLPTLAGDDGMVFLMEHSGTGYAYRLQIDDSADELQFSVTDSAGTAHYAHSDQPIVEGRWYHVAGVVDSNYDMKIYVDGVLQTEQTNSGSRQIADSYIRIGASDTGSRPLDGRIDDIRIYNRALSAAEISDLYYSNPHPKLSIRSAIAPDATNFGSAEQVIVLGDYAFVAAINLDQFTSVDISDPDSPSIADSLTGTGVRDIKGFVLRENYIFAAEHYGPGNHPGLTVLDISDPTNMTKVATPYYDGVNDSPDSIAVSGNYAYIISDNFGGSMYVWNISNPASPSYLYSYGSVDYGGAFIRMYNTTTAFTSNGAANKFCATDLSNPASPAILDCIESGDTAIDDPRDFDFFEKYAVYVDQIENKMVVVDISDLSALSVVGEIADVNGELNAPEGIFIDQHYAYVAANGSDMVSIFDLSDPTNPVLIDSVSDAVDLDGADSVYVENGLAYVANADSGFAIIDLDKRCDTPVRVEGTIVYNGDGDVLQYCDGQDWHRVGP